MSVRVHSPWSIVHGKLLIALLIACSLQLTTLSGCGPTYPKEKFEESIVKICKKEYKLDVKVKTIGKTVAIYVPLPNLIDLTFAISNAAGEKINDVILSVSRVALSTDAKYNFYCVIAHDIRIPEIQIVIVKTVDDVKRFMLNDISRGEYGKRMLIDIRLNPQSQKEHAIKEVFEKMSLDKKWQEQVMNDFFRSEPTALGDIGYWDGRFYIKDVTMEEFLAEQIAGRMKFEFRDDKNLADTLTLKASKAVYSSDASGRFFHIEILAEPKVIKENQPLDVSDKVFRSAVKVAIQVIHGYKFEKFNYIEIVSQYDAKTLKISKDDLENFRKKKLTFEEMANIR